MASLISLLPIILAVLIVAALVFAPLAQRRRERAIFEQMRQARDAAEAEALANCALQAQSKSRLPEKWHDSYRFWLK